MLTVAWLESSSFLSWKCWDTFLSVLCARGTEKVEFRKRNLATVKDTCQKVVTQIGIEKKRSLLSIFSNLQSDSMLPHHHHQCRCAKHVCAAFCRSAVRRSSLGRGYLSLTQGYAYGTWCGGATKTCVNKSLANHPHRHGHGIGSRKWSWIWWQLLQLIWPPSGPNLLLPCPSLLHSAPFPLSTHPASFAYLPGIAVCPLSLSPCWHFSSA